MMSGKFTNNSSVVKDQHSNIHSQWHSEDGQNVLKKTARTLDISVEEISVIKKQKAIRRMKYNNAERVTILKLPKLEIKQNATNGMESHLYQHLVKCFKSSLGQSLSTR